MTENMSDNETVKLMISTGIFLKDNEFVSPIDIQKVFSESFNYNPTLSSCRQALSFLELANFIEPIHENIYAIKNKTIIKQSITPPPHYGANPLYFPG
jgi:hypothetical protein